MDTNDIKNQESMAEAERQHYGHSRADKGRKNRLLLLSLAAVAVVIAVVCMGLAAYNSRKKAAEEALASSIAAEAEAQANAVDYEMSDFTECMVPELNMLAQEYFDAKLAGDVDKLAEIFGRNAADTDAELATRLKAQADWIQSYTLNKVYVANGLDESAKLCLVCYDIDFRRTDTMAPGVMYFYALRDSDGNYTIAENPVKEIHDYILAELETDSAKAIIDESNARLKEALDSDSTLSLIYVSFLSGEIYKESDLDVNRDQEVGFSAEDSILVDADVLANIENEAAEEASIEASLAADDAAESAEKE